MPSTYYIDGYNVIHHAAHLRPLANKHFEAARDALVETVALFCSAAGKRAVIVFDGRGKREQAQVHCPNVAGLQIRYSPADRSADALIERLVYREANRRDICVVSADRGIRDLCGSLGALVMGPDNFLGTVEDALEHIRSKLKHLHRKNRGLRLEERLHKQGKDRLQKLRNSLDEKPH